MWTIVIGSPGMRTRHLAIASATRAYHSAALNSAPRFSVVVPTRDRPDLLDFCLAGIASQTFADVEVIVSDNAVRPSGARDLRPMGARRLAVRHARSPGADARQLRARVRRGDRLSTWRSSSTRPSCIRRPSTLRTAISTTTWTSSRGGTRAMTRSTRRARSARACSGRSPPRPHRPATTRWTTCAPASPWRRRRGIDHVHYVRGKIAFGAFSRPLLERIRDATGRVFYPLAPDYTSMAAGSVLAHAAVDPRPAASGLVQLRSARTGSARRRSPPMPAPSSRAPSLAPWQRCRSPACTPRCTTSSPTIS